MERTKIHTYTDARPKFQTQHNITDDLCVYHNSATWTKVMSIKLSGNTSSKEVRHAVDELAIFNASFTQSLHLVLLLLTFNIIIFMMCISQQTHV